MLNNAFREPKTEWSYTVFGIFQATDETPMLSSENRPPLAELSSLTWTNLVTSVYRWNYINNKTLQLVVMIVAGSFFFGSLKLLEKIKYDDYYADGGQQIPSTDSVLQLILIIFLAMILVLPFVLDGAWKAPVVERTVKAMQPEFRQQGLELNFRKEGSIFMAKCIITVKRSDYVQPTWGNATATTTEKTAAAENRNIPKKPDVPSWTIATNNDEPMAMAGVNV